MARRAPEGQAFVATTTTMAPTMTSPGRAIFVAVPKRRTFSVLAMSSEDDNGGGVAAALSEEDPEAPRAVASSSSAVGGEISAATKKKPEKEEEEPPGIGGAKEGDGVYFFDPSDYVAVGKSDIESDPILRSMSSELGVRKVLGREIEAEFPFGVLVSRTLDTVEDVFVILGRRMDEFKLSRQGSASAVAEGTTAAQDEDQGSEIEDVEDDRETVVVLGSGWAAHALLKVADTSKIKLIVISPTNHFVFTPMLASAAVGTVEYRSMTEAVRAANPLIEGYVEGSATDVDVERKVVTVKLNKLLEEGAAEGNHAEPPTIEVPYDKLVVSVGAKVADAGVRGASKCLRLKSTEDARRLRTSIGECFEYASRPDVRNDPDERGRRVTFLVVGGGPTGVELSGEISDLARDICRPKLGPYKNLRDDVRVVLAHGGDQLLPQFDESMREEAGKSLERRGIDVRYNTYVTEVRDGEATLSTKCVDIDGCNVSPITGKILASDRDETTLPVGLTIWCAGTAPVPFTSKLLNRLPNEARCARGRVRVDEWLRPPVDDPSLRGTIFVLGDAANFDDGDESLPQTAQVAGQQGAYLARMLSRGYDMTLQTPALPKASDLRMNGEGGKAEEDDLRRAFLRLRGLEKARGFEFLNLGLLAYLGGGEALSQVQLGDFPIFKFAGSVSFVLWRSVYLVKQVATKNRMLVTFDWIKSFLFGRDITRL